MMFRGRQNLKNSFIAHVFYNFIPRVLRHRSVKRGVNINCYTCLMGQCKMSKFPLLCCQLGDCFRLENIRIMFSRDIRQGDGYMRMSLTLALDSYGQLFDRKTSINKF